VRCVGGVGRDVLGVRWVGRGVVGRVHGVSTVVVGFGRGVLGVMELGGVCGVEAVATGHRVKPGGRTRSNSRRWRCRRFRASLACCVGLQGGGYGVSEAGGSRT